MNPDKKLKEQVRAELKKRRYVTYAFLILGLLYVALNLLFGDMGFLSHRELKSKKNALEAELNDIRLENKRMSDSLKTYNEKGYYVEKNARENFGLAGKGEYMFLYEEKDGKKGN